MNKKPGPEPLERGFVEAAPDASKPHRSPEPDELSRAEARIYRRSAAPVQSGTARTAEWIVEFEPAQPPDIDPLMGWLSSGDVLQQVRMSFADLGSAEAYCRREGIPYTVTRPVMRPHRPRTYAENFESVDGGAKPIYPH